MRYHIWWYFAILPKVWHNCGNIAFSTFEQILIVEADIDFSIGNQSIIELLLSLS